MGASRIEDTPGFIADLRALDARFTRKQKGSDYDAAVRARCLGELNRLSSATFFRHDEERKGLSESSRARAITRYRNAIREELGTKHRALDYLRVTDERQQALQIQKRVALVEQHHARRPLDVARHIEIARNILEKLASEPLLAPTDKRGKTAPGFVSPLEAAGAVIAVTGRRGPSEVLRDIAPFKETGFDFAPIAKVAADLFDSGVSPKHRWAVMFSGQRKTKGSSNAQTEAFQIPVLVEPELVIGAIEKIRARFTYKHQHCGGEDAQAMDDTKLQSSYGRNLSNYTKGDLREQVGPGYRDRDGVALSPQELRAAYATCCYELYAPLTTSWNAYTARILGHSKAGTSKLPDIMTSMSYDVFFPYGAAKDYRDEVRASAHDLIASLEKSLDTLDDAARAHALANIAAIRAKMKG